MKRILSVFLALICLFSSVISSNLTFAEGGDPSKEKILPRILRPSATDKQTELKESAIKNRNFIREKAFLTAVLCLSGVDVYIKYPRLKKEFLNFAVTKIGDNDVKSSGILDHLSQIEALIQAVKQTKDPIKIGFERNCSRYISDHIRINNRRLKLCTVLDYGEKILELIKDSQYFTNENHENNLTQNIAFKSKVETIFEDLLKKRGSSPSSSQKEGKIKVQRWKPSEIQKAFLVALICSAGTDVYIKPQRNTIGKLNNLNVIQLGFQVLNTTPDEKSNGINDLLKFLSESQKNINFSYNFDPQSQTIKTAVVDNVTLKSKDISKIGRQTLNLIQNKYVNPKNSSGKFINLTEDYSFKKIIPLFLNDMDYSESSTEELPTQEHFKNEIAKSNIYPKTFLTALLCSTGTNVSVEFKKDTDGKINDFTIYKIENIIISPEPEKQIEALTFMLNNQKGSLCFKPLIENGKLQQITVENLTFSKNDIEKWGQEILNLVCQKEQEKEMTILGQKPSAKNLTSYFFLCPKLKETLCKLLTPPSLAGSSEIGLKFEAIAKNFRGLEIKYQKSFLMGIAIAMNITTISLITEKNLNDPLGDIYLQIFNGCCILEKEPLNKKVIICLIKTINYLLNDHNIHIHSLSPEYKNIIEYATINGVTLNKEDIFYLGNKFHQLIRKEENFIHNLRANAISVKESVDNHEVLLNKNPNFINAIQDIFKEETGITFLT